MRISRPCDDNDRHGYNLSMEAAKRERDIIRADERAKCIAEIEALHNELHAVLWETRRTGGLIQMTDAVIVALSAALSVTNQPEED